ncbi:PDR/VanB family oxidoreductase [Microbacterium profundi]|uniref:PDR/VanB family oxidoreductase n=1 Tax=Microbacterium profundi TaxID=450380 RepID=UPI001F468B74|nr:PDR/VanB family oxidoreductase [Microbacterium profundi]MCE7481651.1 PDR/VanB family oxidoreductase [Microbacterium profundi]
MTTDAQTAAGIDIPRGFVDARIVGREQLADEVVLFDLEIPGAPQAAPVSGSHLEIFLPVGEGEVRHYSVCATSDSRFQIAVLKEKDGRGGSAWLHERATVGTVVPVRGPRNTFAFNPAGPALFIAGGIGITPILPMIDEARAAGIEWSLLYLGAGRSRMAFADNLTRATGNITLWSSDTMGRVDLGMIIRDTAPTTTIYACGPERMLRELSDLTAASGHALVIEDFTIGHVDTAELAVAPESADDHAFTVELADGTEVPVPRGCSILTALSGAGIRTLSSCQRGECGTCETPIIAGEADHRDSVLSQEERDANEVMMICISRAKGDRLVLDI